MLLLLYVHVIRGGIQIEFRSRIEGAEGKDWRLVGKIRFGLDVSVWCAFRRRFLFNDNSTPSRPITGRDVLNSATGLVFHH
jgi:hypothetical protein